MQRRTLFAGLALAGTSLLAACGASSPPPAAAAQASVAGGCESRFTLQNRSSNSVIEFYYRPAGAAEWGNDRFGQRMLGRGLTTSFRTVGDGRSDLRITWASGRQSQLDNVNLCETPLIVADNDRLFVPTAGAQPAAAARTRAATPASTLRRNPPN